MKVKCQFCRSEWTPRELEHHPDSQEWAGGELVACPYCIHEASQLTLALACLGRKARRASTGRTRR